MRSRRTASSAATASRSCCRRRRRSRRSTSRSTSSAPLRCRSPCCSAPTRSPIACRTPARRRVITNAPGLAKLAEIRRSQGDALAGLQLVLSIDGPGDGALGFPRDAGARVRGFRAGRDRGRRSGDDDLHLGHHRPAQGRAARPSRADRPYAGHRAAARVLPAARRPLLDAGRLGLGRRPARLPAAEPLLRRAGGGASASTSSIPRKRSR